MARTNALVKCSIWDRASDFRQLHRNTQRLYLLLLSQPQINNCGIVPFVPERWWRMATDDSRDELEQALDELKRERYVVVDEETGELLVRTFIRHDRIEGQPNLIKAAWREYRAIESDTLRQLLAEAHLWLAEDDLAKAVAIAREAVEEPAEETPSQTPSERGKRRGSGSSSDERGSGRSPRARARPRPRTPTPVPAPEEGNASSGGPHPDSAHTQSSPGVAPTTATRNGRARNDDAPVGDAPRRYTPGAGEALVRNALWDDPHLADALREHFRDIPDSEVDRLNVYAIDFASTTKETT